MSSPTEPATTVTTTLKGRVAEELAARREQLLALSHAIHADPELSWQEHRAAARVADILREAGFAVEVGAYGVETAVEAVIGDGDLSVVICAEYDALPGVGHACGHNVIASAGVGAALALAPVAQEAGLRVTLLGTPAEEHGGGKVSLLQAGAWERADFSMMVHGMTGPDRGAASFRSTAVDRFEVEFTGVAAHAAGAPEHAVNAGAAASLAITAIAMLRQHIVSTSNLNAFISFGGEATNVIADRAVLQVEVRAAELDEWAELRRRALACFEGAAIATGCSWSHRPTEHAYAPMRPDETLAGLWDANLEARGRAIVHEEGIGGGSTDMGNVSWVVPTIHPVISFIGEETVPHHPDFAASAVTPAADDAVMDGAAALAWTTLDIALDPVVREDFRQRTAQRPAGATTQPLPGAPATLTHADMEALR